MKRLSALLALTLLGLAAVPSEAQQTGPSNMSVLINLPPGGSQIIGFVCPGTPPTWPPQGFQGGYNPGSPLTYLLIRAVGPSLATFGISNPAPSPHMILTDAQGVQLGFSYTAGPPTNQVDYLSVFNSVGAFPLTGGEQLGTAFNFGGVGPGVHTIKVVDDSGKGGMILIEIYSISASVAEGSVALGPG